MIKYSIIIPFFNNQENLPTLFKTLEDYKDHSEIEIIIIDDSSKQNEFNALSQEASNFKNLKLLKNEENSGVAVTRNRGIRMAQGKYIAFLDADDAWSKDRLFRLWSCIQQEDIDFFGSTVDIINHHIFDEYRNHSKFSKFSIKYLNPLFPLFKTYFNTPSIIVKTEVINKYLFNETLRYGEDSDCWRRIFLSHKPYTIEPSGVFSFKHNYLSDGGSLSSNTYEMSKSQLKSLISQMLFEVKPWSKKFFYFAAILFSFIKACRRQLQYFLKS